MIRYFLSNLIAHFRMSKALYVLTVLGVALGVAAIVAIQTLTQSAISTFGAGVEVVSGTSDLSVFGNTPTLPEETLPDVLADENVVAAWPVLRVDVAVEGHRGEYLEVLGLDVLRYDSSNLRVALVLEAMGDLGLGGFAPHGVLPSLRP